MVAAARRPVLLRTQRFRLRYEDLEDCYGQATLELITRARAGGSFVTRQHLANVLEQRFLSRINDRRRALSGRSPMQAALEGAVPLQGGLDDRQLQIADSHAELERIVFARHQLRQVSSLACALSEDQRRVLASQLAQVPCAEFCQRHGWSGEKYRKVAQRARARLKRLIELDNGEDVQSEGERAARGKSGSASGKLELKA